jgi:shikimate kinase
MIPNSQPPADNLMLIGFMGSGKSSVGRLLATNLGFRFVDTDALVIRASGMPIADLFAQQGEAAFRDYEADALASLLGHSSLVVATGGGIVIREGNRALLHRLGLVVGLTATVEVIFDRVSRNNKRPLLQTPNPHGTIADLLAERSPIYSATADLLIDTTARTHAQVAEAILSEARRRGICGA